MFPYLFLRSYVSIPFSISIRVFAFLCLYENAYDIYEHVLKFPYSYTCVHYYDSIPVMTLPITVHICVFFYLSVLIYFFCQCLPTFYPYVNVYPCFTHISMFIHVLPICQCLPTFYPYVNVYPRFIHMSTFTIVLPHMSMFTLVLPTYVNIYPHFTPHVIV